MAKVTRIAYSKDMTKSKLDRLIEIANRLGSIRTDIWRRFGSLAGLEYKSDRAVRDEWLKDDVQFNVPARLWKATLADVWADIVMYREAAKSNVRKRIRSHTEDSAEQKRLYLLLKANQWDEDPYLRRMMRKYFKHGHTKEQKRNHGQKEEKARIQAHASEGSIFRRKCANIRLLRAQKPG